MKNTYIKKNHVYWNMKKINKHSMKLWYFIVAWLVLTILYALVSRYVNRGPLVDPRCPAGFGKVERVMASENIEPINRIDTIYHFVRHNESNGGTKGLAVTCAKKGKINEVGYLLRPGYCFDNASDQEVTVKNWFSKRLNAGMTIQQALIVYTGNAPYAYTFK